jgi:hypothetical protein
MEDINLLKMSEEDLRYLRMKIKEELDNRNKYFKIEQDSRFSLRITGLNIYKNLTKIIEIFGNYGICNVAYKGLTDKIKIGIDFKSYNKFTSNRSLILKELENMKF